jgi:hypothetical protein
MNTTLTRPAVTDEARYERHAIARVTDALRREFAGRVPAESIERAVADARERFGDATIREFVPVMVERAAGASMLDEVGSAAVPSPGLVVHR